MNKSDSVRITDSPAEAQYCHDNRIPYIVWLHDGNRGDSFPSGAFCVENKEDISERDLDRVYRRTKGLPWDIVGTERLMVREITVEDVPRLYELYADKNATRYMEPLFEDISQEIEYTREYIKNIYGFYGYGMWVIVLKSTGEVIGRVGLEYKEELDGLEFGVMLGSAYRGKGYAYEAGCAVLKYGKTELGCRSVYAIVHKENKASRRVCERLGMKADGSIFQKGGEYIKYCTILAI